MANPYTWRGPAKYANADGTLIEVEIYLDMYNLDLWVPFGASSYDVEPRGVDTYNAIIASGIEIAPFVPWPDTE